MTQRIAFCGASGTGKTTLAQRLAAHLGLPSSPSMARRAAQELGLDSPYAADTSAQRQMTLPSLSASHEYGTATEMRQKLQTRITHSRIAWQDEHAQGFVADRTSYDDLAYSIMHGLPARQLVELGEAIALQNQRLGPTYTRVVLCPVASFWRHGGDSARVNDLAYHRTFEAVLVNLLTNFGVPFDRSLEQVSDLGRAAWLREQFGVPVGAT